MFSELNQNCDVLSDSGADLVFVVGIFIIQVKNLQLAAALT